MNDLEVIRNVPTVSPNDMGYYPQALEPQPANDYILNEAGIQTCYANLCRFLGNPEELIIDFGFNSQVPNVPSEPTVIQQRVVTGWHIAKKLLEVLTITIQRHEAAFGVLETDIQKRVHRT